MDNLIVTTPVVLGVRSGTTQVLFATQPVITLRDQYNNTCSTLTDNVVLTITGATTPVGAALAGTTTVAAVAGVATFTNVTVAPGDDNDITDLDLLFTVGGTTVYQLDLAN